MKKLGILLMTAMLFVSVASFAQTTNAVVDLKSAPASGAHITDTVTNTATAFLTARIPGSPAVGNIGFRAVKISGTAAGTASLQGSNDGVDFYAASATTYTVTDVASQTFSWALSGFNYLYYRVTVTGSGTSSYTIKANAFGRN